MSVLLAERSRLRLLDDLRLEIAVLHHLGLSLASLIAGGAIYGAVLGSWHGPRLALYVAIKIPLLLIATAAITALFNWVAASLLGLHLKLAQTFTLSVVPLAVAALVAAAVAPIAWLFTSAAPPPTEEHRTLHNMLYLVHVTIIAGSGLVGTSTLRDVLLRVCDGESKLASRVRIIWVAAYALVGGELSWALRPFVGSVYLPVQFLRPDALDGNVYEFILTDIVPHLLKQLGVTL